MAFVYSQPRWGIQKENQNPGPGHYPNSVPISTARKPDEHKSKIRKGKSLVQKLLLPLVDNDPQSQLMGRTGSCLHQDSKDMSRQNKKRDTLSAVKEMGLNKSKVGENLGRMLQINGLKNTGNTGESSAQESGLEQIKSVIKQFKARKTSASIKPVSSQMFYVGSQTTQPQQQSKQKPSNKSTQKKREESAKTKTLKTQANIAIDPLADAFEMPQKQPINKKPISAHHPFAKKILNADMENLYDDKSTRIQEEDTEGDEYDDDDEFVHNAVPGPGSYEVTGFHQSTKRNLMFTEVMRDRFVGVQKNSQFTQVCYDYYKPFTSQSKSRASQNKVGFGRALTDNGFKGFYENDNPIFYDDYQSIQNKCLKNMIKDSSNPGFFSSKACRFPPTPPTISSQNFKIDLQKQQQIAQLKSLQKLKPSYPFNSGLTRKMSHLPQILDIDYQGQQHKTISNSLQNMLCQPKYMFEECPSLQVPPPEQNKPQSPQKRVKSDIEMKYQLVESLNGFRHRDRKINKGEGKGFTFGTKDSHPSRKQTLPDPGQYHRDKDWMKNSFNIRFARGYQDMGYSKENIVVACQDLQVGHI